MSTTELIVCTSCGFSDRDECGRNRGERLQSALVKHLDERGRGNGDPGPVQVRGAECFMACGRGCNVHLRAPDKMAYLFCDLDPNDDSGIERLLDYVERYRQSESGVVPYKEWPEGIGKKFLCRIPPP